MPRNGKEDIMDDIFNKDVFSNNLLSLIEKSEKSRSTICKETNIPYTTMTNWIDKNTYPRLDKIEKLAKYFNITKEELLNSNDMFKLELEKACSKKDISWKELNVIKNYLELDKEQKEIVDALILRRKAW